MSPLRGFSWGGMGTTHCYNHVTPSGFFLENLTNYLYNHVTLRGLILSFQPIKKVFFVVFDFEFLQKLQVFFLECFFAMVFFLIQNVLIHRIHLGMGVGECAIAVLPGKFIGEELPVIDEITAVVFDIADQI